MKIAAVTLWLGAILMVDAAAQQPPVKSVTTGVVLDVTVVDAKGNPILDIGPDEFEVSEDGARQRIVSATLVRAGVIRPSNAGSAVVADSGSGQAARPEPTAVTQPAQSISTPSVTAILFDRLSPESRALARRAALAYVATLTTPNDYAGVFLADLSLKTFSPLRTIATTSCAVSISCQPQRQQTRRRPRNPKARGSMARTRICPQLQELNPLAVDSATSPTGSASSRKWPSAPRIRARRS
jgi:hypothetical protein